MTGLRDLSAGIYGAWRLAHGDSAGLVYFDASERGFWRSFWAALIVAPGYALIVAINLSDPDTTIVSADVNGLRLFLIEAIAYLIGWTAFPLAMTALAKKLDREGLYMRYIVANNWGGVIEMSLFLPTVAVAASAPALQILPFAVGCLMFVYQWFVARTALSLTSRQALAPVALNFAIGVAIAFVARTLIQSGP